MDTLTYPPAPGEGVFDHREKPHAVVIGSGFGGLAAAIRLGARGYRVTVLEKMDKPGGRAYVREIDGHVFDRGPTIVTAPFLLEELWRLCGRSLADDVTLKSLTPFYRIRFSDGATFDCSGDEAAMRQEVGRLSPGDVDGYEAFMRASSEIYRVGFEELGEVPFDSIADMARILPDMIRHQSYRSVYSAVSKYVRDPRLRIALSFHPLLIGGNPFAVTSIYCLISYLERRFGVHFAIGGTGQLVSGMVRLIEQQGGSIRCGAEVREILVEDGRATGAVLASGEHLPAGIVVSNADAAWTYRRLLPEIHRRRWTNRKIDNSRYSMGLFVWYFGTRRRYEDVEHHTILLGPRYRGLLTDIFKRKVLPDDFSLYLHRPTATDPSLAPEGCDTFYALSPVPNLEGPTDWAEAAEPYRQSIEAYLGETILPGLRSELTVSELVTPQYFRNELLSHSGAGFSLEPVLTQSAWFRPHNRSEEIENLFLVGAGTHPGAGLPGVLTSAKILDKVVPDVAAFAQR